MKIKMLKSVPERILLALIIIAAAIFLRWWPLNNMGHHMAYLTFFPAVTIAALYGGRISGMIATILSSLIIYAWQFTSNTDFTHLAGMEGFGIFFMTGLLISNTSEALIREQARSVSAVEIANLEKIRAEEARLGHQKLSEYAKQLEESMQGTLLAVSNMVEQRDPYTAGHERRVGIIAADIAREMGWPENKCKELQMIGVVHDIGKIGIPAEILTKPGRLTPIEYELVQGHVEKGYEILKDVKFPLPISEIIHQHHERMDGSGYPQGLKGEEIHPEARILAVADVIESMSSFRPYRSALGIEVALKEITDHRGSLYDAVVVDVLLKLVNEQGYQLPS
jgi:putative nucleotidyltransferase with HDIG domain